MDFRGLMNGLKDIKGAISQIKNIRDVMAKTRLVGESGGGMVKLEFNGVGELVSCKIDPTLTRDVRVLEDLVVTAHKNGFTKLQEFLREMSTRPPTTPS